MTAFPIDLDTTRGFNILEPRNPHFTGRDTPMAELRQRLQATGRPLVISGLAGIGKTALAREYAHLHRQEYGIVWWLRASDPVSLRHDYQALRSVLLIHAPPLDPDLIRDAIRAELEERGGWLLIFDGAADPEVLDGYVPRSGANGHVVVTTQNGDWSRTANATERPIPWQTLSLGGLDRADSVRLLRGRSGRTDSALAAAKLAQALGDLPLALEQAAALVAQAGIGFEEYLYRFEAHWGELLRRGPSASGRAGVGAIAGRAGYADLVAMSLELSVREVERTAPEAAEILKLAAFFGPDPFRLEWLARGICRGTQSINATLSDPEAVRSAIASLNVFSLIEAERPAIAADATLRVHPLVSTLIRVRMPLDEYELWSGRAVHLLEEAFRFDAQDVSTWRDAEAILPHALAAATHLPEDVEVAQAVRICNRAGEFLIRQARYAEARPLLEQAMALGLKVYDADNPRLAAIANNLARVLQRLGDLQSARDHLEWALALDERTYGPDHPHVAELLNNYAMCLAVQDQHAAAREQFERALAIYEALGQSGQTKAAVVLNNLGYVRMNQGDVAGGWELLGQALQILEAAHGPNHPDVAGVVSNRGHGLRLRGDAAGALGEYQRALSIDESVFGPHHPTVARDLSNMGHALQDKKDFAAARSRFTRALAIDERILGPSHPSIAQRVSDLGWCLKGMDDVDGAAACFARAATLRRGEMQAPAPVVVG